MKNYCLLNTRGGESFRRWYVCKDVKTHIFSIALTQRPHIFLQSHPNSILFHTIVFCHPKPPFKKMTFEWHQVTLLAIFLFCDFLFTCFTTPSALEFSLIGLRLVRSLLCLLCLWFFQHGQNIYVIYLSFIAIVPIVIIVLRVIKLLHVAKSQAKRIARELARYGANIHNQAPTNKGLHTFLLITIGAAWQLSGYLSLWCHFVKQPLRFRSTFL